MTLKIKKDGAWKEASSLKVKINGEWKDVSTLYSKKDGAWVTVYNSGALIEFVDYPYAIPVAQGWQYSTDKTTWTTVSADGTINNSGTFTGFIKVGAITLTDFYTQYIPPVYGATRGITNLYNKVSLAGSFALNNVGYVCGGYKPGTAAISSVETYDINENHSSGSSLAEARYAPATFVINEQAGFVVGGNLGAGISNDVDRYDTAGVRTSPSYTSCFRTGSASFVNNSKGYVCGGTDENDNSLTSVDKFDVNGVRSKGSALSQKRYACGAFTNGTKGYVCGGFGSSSSDAYTTVDVYSSSGSRTTGNALSVKRAYSCTFVNNSKGYVCGGYYMDGGTWHMYQNRVDVYDTSGNRTTGTSLSEQKYGVKSIKIGSRVYLCSGQLKDANSNLVEIYDENGTKTLGPKLYEGLYWPAVFSLGSKGFICGGSGRIINQTNIVNVLYDEPESYITKIPITKGSKYDLNGVSGTAQTSDAMEFNSKVSGTINYKAGLAEPPVYSIIYDKSLASDPEACLTYAGKCKGYTPMVGGSGNADEGSWAEGNGTLFDAIKVGYLVGTRFIEVNKNGVNTSTGNYSFTRIPRIYEKITVLDDNRVRLDMALEKFNGSRLHPAFTINKEMINNRYIGRFMASMVSDTTYILQSASGKTIYRNDTYGSMRGYARQNGPRFGILGYWDWDLVNKLYLLAFKNWDSQSALGVGYTKDSYTSSGSAYNTSWMYGKSDNASQVSVLGLVNWWGNFGTYIDNFIGYKGTYYVDNISNSSSSSTSAYSTNIGSFGGTSGKYTLKCKAGQNNFFISESVDDSVETGTCDMQTWARDSYYYAGIVGGMYGEGNNAGAFYLNASRKASAKDSYVGSRLTYYD